jgi:hypothetical protein
LGGLAFEFGSKVSTRFSEDSAFGRCSSLQSIWIPSSIETIPEKCFVNFENLSLLGLAGGSRISVFGESAFDWTSLRTICIPSSIEILAGSCFRRCYRLSTVSFERGCRPLTLEDYAFAACRSLPSICLPSSLETVSKICFTDCANLLDISFEAGCQISTLGIHGFGRRFSLQSICIPSSIHIISRFCFRTCSVCSQLSNLTFESASQVNFRVWENRRFPGVHRFDRFVSTLAFTRLLVWRCGAP